MTRRHLRPGVDFNPDMAIERGNGWACRRCNVLACGPTCPKCGADEAGRTRDTPLLALAAVAGVCLVLLATWCVTG